MEWPKISVVTPSWNQGAFIEETFKSIHSQGYPNLEHIVIDGGSTDDSVDIINRYEDRLAYWVSEPDEGQTDALAKGFDRATGDILCWLNSDDLFEPGCLFEVAEYFMRHPDVQFIYGDGRWIDADGRPIKTKREHRWNWFVWLYDHNFIGQPSAFWRSSLYREVGGIDRSFDLAMDADLWARFSERSQPHHVPRVWSAMRFYPEQKNTRLRDRSDEEIRLIRSRYVRRRGWLAERLLATAARVFRVILKAARGGYPPREVVAHAIDVVGLGRGKSGRRQTVVK